jgi:hypothetical protein|tara:strand:- start:287 stop:1381 length:1095 start_codon:yes stop_codon:yes gene_type:complete
MKKIILALLTTVLLFGQDDDGGNYFVDNFLKYSTFYTSLSLESPFVPQQKFAVNTEAGTFEETTEEIQGSYNISFGLRKLARFKYQSKKSNFYDGSENELSDVATVGAVSGWEYLVKWSSIRSFGEEYVDSESWMRYLGDWFVVKGSYVNFGRQDLEFGQLDIRYRKPIGHNWNFTVGSNFRGHPAYGLFPFNDWLVEANGAWWELAYNYGYDDEFWFIDPNQNGIQDPGEPGNYHWYDENGNLVSDTDNEFYKYYYGDLISQYNDEQVDALGWQYEASFVIGIDYYNYTKKFWLHGWGSVIPFGKGLTDYSFTYGKGDLDFDIGVVTGWKLNRSFGLFGECRYLSYWGIDAYEIKAGLNYTIY